MKPLNQPKTLQTNTESDFTFNIKTSGHAFKILSDSLYKNKLLAIIREYLTNALDAHRDNNKLDTPFEVAFSLDNEWSVRDFGKGLSEEDIQNLFCTYFSSSKTDTNEQTGMLGLGCKSGFAYADEFTVTSWFNGFETLYHLYIENSIPKVSIINKKPSDEPTGLKVSIQIKDEDTVFLFPNELRVIRYFPLSVIPVRHLEQVKHFKESLIDFDTCYMCNQGDSGVLMGNVLYPLDMDLLPDVYKIKNKCHNKIFKVDIGSVSILPSREGLSYDKPTVKFLTKFINKSFIETQQWAASYVKTFKPKIKNFYRVFNTFIHSPYVRNYLNNFSDLRESYNKLFKLNHTVKLEYYSSYDKYSANFRIFYVDQLPEIALDDYIILETKLKSTKENKIINDWLYKESKHSVSVYKVKHKFHKKELRKILKQFYRNKIFNSYEEFFNFIYPEGLPKKPKEAKSTESKSKKVNKYTIVDDDDNAVELPIKDIKELAVDTNNYFFPLSDAQYKDRNNKLVSHFGLGINIFYLDSYAYKLLNRHNKINYKQQFDELIRSTVSKGFKEYQIYVILSSIFDGHKTWDYLLKPNSFHNIYTRNSSNFLKEYADILDPLSIMIFFFYTDEINKYMYLDLPSEDINNFIVSKVIDWFKDNGYGQLIDLWIQHKNTIPRCEFADVIKHLDKVDSFTQLLKDITNELITKSESNIE